VDKRPKPARTAGWLARGSRFYSGNRSIAGHCCNTRVRRLIVSLIGGRCLMAFAKMALRSAKSFIICKATSTITEIEQAGLENPGAKWIFPARLRLKP
jgi:hypothetical protein